MRDATGSPPQHDTQDTEEIREWCDALDGVLASWGPSEGREEEQVDEFFYITVTNENVENPSLPAQAHDGVLRGLYLFRPGSARRHRIQLFGSGAIMGEVLQAAGMSPWAPTDSGATTPGPHCVHTSRWTPGRSCRPP